LHVDTLGIGAGRHCFFKAGGYVRDNRFGLRTVTSMKVDDEIPETRDHVC
jgi:hypothetical protein